ncbi:MAG: hypothetical protein WBF71_01575 [Microthrixaceae bacterium]
MGRPIAERGTALILVPTMMLVLLALGAIAIDLSVLHLSHRTVHRVVSSAADDAAGMIDTRQVQIDGSVRIDSATARRTVAAHLEAASLPGTLQGAPQVEVSGDGLSLTVRVKVEVPHILLRSMPGARRSELLTVSASARILR